MTKTDPTTDVYAQFQTMFENLGLSKSEAMERSAELNEKFSKIVLDAAVKSSKLAASWTEESISYLYELSKAENNPEQISRDMNKYAKDQAATMMEKMSTYAELAQAVQADTLALFTEAGRELFVGQAAPDGKSSKKD